MAGVYQYTLPDPKWEPKTITINGENYHDDNFTKRYDYSKLTGKNIEFYEPVTSSDFVKGSDTETAVSVSDLDELEEVLHDLDAPNIVIGYTLWLVNGTWEEAYTRIYGYEQDYETLQGNTIGMAFGVNSDSHAQYYVSREPYKLIVRKMYKSGSGQSFPIWALNIQFDPPPPYTGTVFRASK